MNDLINKDKPVLFAKAQMLVDVERFTQTTITIHPNQGVSCATTAMLH
jgi:hypothetical protein